MVMRNRREDDRDAQHVEEVGREKWQLHCLSKRSEH